MAINNTAGRKVRSRHQFQKIIVGALGVIDYSLNGAGDLNIAGDGTVQFGNSFPGDSYTGTITIDSTAKVRMENNRGLSGGTVSVSTGSGLFQIGEGFENGVVQAPSAPGLGVEGDGNNANARD